MGWLINTTRRPLYPGKENRYPLYTRLGRPQGRSGRLRKISPPLGLDPQTVQPVASCYTDCHNVYIEPKDTVSAFLCRNNLHRKNVTVSLFLYRRKCHSISISISNQMSLSALLYRTKCHRASTSIPNYM